MAKWTFSEYSHLPTDAGGNPLAIFGPARRSAKLIAAGEHVVGSGTQYLRFCGDTAAHVKVGAGAADTDPFVPAGAEHVVAARPGDVISIILA